MWRFESAHDSRASHNYREIEVQLQSLCQYSPDARNLVKWSLFHPRPQAQEECNDTDVEMVDTGVIKPMEHTAVAVGNNNYILHLCKVGSFIAAGLSNGNICLVEEIHGALQQVGLLKGHSAAVRGLSAYDQQLYSASEDGTARSWDLSNMKELQRFTHGGKAGLSAVNATETLLAAGADDGTLLFWDRRTAALKASFHDTHAEAVTQVLFPDHESGAGNWLVSSSADGLVQVMDLQSGMDEDEAFQAALNSTPSVASCGTYGPDESKLWALSQVESLHLWEWAAALDEEVPGGEGTFADDGDVRASLVLCQEGRPGLPEPLALVSMTCTEGSLRLASTSESGDVAVFRVDEPDAPGSRPTYTPELVLQGAHKDVVRAMLWPGAGSAEYVTGGDDGIISLWRATSADVAGGSTERALDGHPKKRQRQT